MTKSLETLMVDLKAAADKATPGQWSAFIDVASSTYGVFAKKVDDVISWMGFDGRKNAGNNAKFIALASPKNIKALIAALEQAQSEAKEFRHRLRNEQAITEDADKRIAELQEQKDKWAAWAIALGAKADELEARPLCVKLPEDFPDDDELMAEIEFLDDESVDIKTAQWLKELRRRRAGGTLEGSD